MALVLADRVQETTTTSGTGTVTLAGAVSGYQSFAAVGNGNTTYYTITDGANWEVGIGTYTSSGTTLSRDTVLASSNSGSKITLSGGIANVFLTYPAERSVSTATPQTFTSAQTFSGSTSNSAAVLTNALETATVSATAATGTIALYPSTQSVLYYTTNASANWTVNLTWSSGTTLNTVLSTGQSVTVAFLVTQGATAYYNSTVQVDGTTSGVTTKWQGGAPSAGNASGVDVYTYTVIKTGSAAFTVFASVTQFK
jgi:hypothetical protein